MSESAGSCAVETQFSMSRGINDKMREIAREEIRKNTLEEKRANGDLTKAEALELANLKIGAALDDIATLKSGSVCYMA